MTVSLETTDVAFAGAVDIYILGRLARHTDVSGFLGPGAAAVSICAMRLDLCTDPADWRLPAQGNGTLTVRFDRLTGREAYRVTGGVGLADRDAFVFGPWINTSIVRIPTR